MESNREFNERSGALPVLSGTRLPVSGRPATGQAGGRAPIEGLWPEKRQPSLSARWAGLSAGTRKAVICALAGLCLLALLIPLALHAAGASDGGDTGQNRLPGVIGSGTAESAPGTFAVPAETAAEVDPAFASEGSTEQPPEPDTGASSAVTEAVGGTDVPEPDTLPDTDVPAEAVTDTASGTAADTDADTVAVTDTGTDPEVPPEKQPDVAGPGAVRRDLSESERGPDHVQNDTDRDPRSVGAWAPGYVEPPVVLLVCSRPFEAYTDGDGGGTVSGLAIRLANALRSRGLTVVLIGPSLTGLTPESSVKECRERTQSLIRYYCRLYNNVALVLDLHRGAEMAEGTLLATSGVFEGHDSAQLRFIADGLRPDGDGVPAGTVSALDFSLARALRRAVFEISPTVSRPVWWRTSAGLVPGGLCPSGTSYGADPSDGPRLVTVELGAAGNTYASAEALIPLLARAVAAVMGE